MCSLGMNIEDRSCIFNSFASHVFGTDCLTQERSQLCTLDTLFGSHDFKYMLKKCVE